MSQQEIWKYRKICQRLVKPVKCEVCGAKKRLHRHHVDKDITHNTLDNIQVVCFKCHIEIHGGRTN